VVLVVGGWVVVVVLVLVVVVVVVVVVALVVVVVVGIIVVVLAGTVVVVLVGATVVVLVDVLVEVLVVVGAIDVDVLVEVDATDVDVLVEVGTTDVDVDVDEVLVDVGGVSVTVTGAVSVADTTVKLAEVPPAVLVYVPGDAFAVTLKCRLSVPGVCPVAAGTLKGPFHVSVEAAIAGSVVVAPVLEPGTYANPPGKVSAIVVRDTLELFGLEIVIVYPSCPPCATVDASAVFAVVNGRLPAGEKVVRWERVTDPLAGTEIAQLNPAPLSSFVAQSQVSGNALPDDIASHTSE
jgi:hypothetical protein